MLEKALNPSGPRYWKETYKGAFQDIFFTTTLDRTPAFIAAMTRLPQDAGYPERDIGVYIQPQNMGTSCHCEFTLPYDAAERAGSQAGEGVVHRKRARRSRAMGAYYLRPHGIWARLQLNKDAQSYALLLRKMKGIFDPNNIMNTGKLSI